MKLKRAGLMVCLVLSFIILVGCSSNKVTQDELIDNKWSVLFEESKDSEVTLIADFTKENMILSLDTSKVESEASNEFEELGEELAKNLIGTLNYKVDYKLNGNTIHLKCEELDLDNDFDVKKEKDKIIFANQKTKVEMVLTPTG